MAKNRYINTKFWKDPYIRTLDPSEKLLFLYFLSNPMTNVAGIYEISLDEISHDTGFDEKTVSMVLQRFTSDTKIFYIDGYLYIKNFQKHQEANSKMKHGMKRILNDLSDELLAKISQIDIGFDRLLKGLERFELSESKSKSESELELESEFKFKLERLSAMKKDLIKSF